MKTFEYVSTAGYSAIVPDALHKMIQRGVSVGAVNGGKLTKDCKFTAVSKDEVAAKVSVRKAAAKVIEPKKVVAKKPVAKKPVAKKPSKYGTHPDGTVQFVPARGIYHGYMGGKIVTVKRDAAKVKADLAARGVTAFTDVTVEG